MMLLLTYLALVATRPADASLRDRVSLRTCQDTLTVADEASLRNWLIPRAVGALGEVDHVVLVNFRRHHPEFSGRRAFAVDEVLELLSEQPASWVTDLYVRRRSWQLRIFGDVWATPPGLAVSLLGDRLRWDEARVRPARGEFVIQLHWEDTVPPGLIERLPDFVAMAHHRGPAARAPLRIVRTGDPFDGELYVAIDVTGEPDARYLLTLRLLGELQNQLVDLAVSLRRP